jgi:hypothetical protein
VLYVDGETIHAVTEAFFLRADTAEQAASLAWNQVAEGIQPASRKIFPDKLHYITIHTRIGWLDERVTVFACQTHRISFVADRPVRE